MNKIRNRFGEIMILERKAIAKLQAIIAIVIIVVVVVAGGTYYYFVSTPALPAEIKIGVNLPLTGYQANDGQMGRDGALLAAQHINDNGGVLGKKLALVIGDDESKPDKAAALMERLITLDNVVAVVGGVVSTLEVVTIDITHRYGIPQIVTTAVAEEITSRRYGNVFRTCGLPVEWGVAEAEFLNETVKPETIAMLVQDSTIWWQISDAFVQSLQEVAPEITIVSKQYVSAGSTEFTPVLTEMLAKNPDIICSWFTAVANAALREQLRELDPDIPQIMGNFIWNTEEYLEMVGGAVGELTTFGERFTKAPYTSKTIPFWDAYVEAYGKNPSGVSADLYQGVLLIAEAIERAGSVDPEKIINALEENEFEGIYGEIRFQPRTIGTVTHIHQYSPDPAVLFLQIQGGEPKVVFPSSLKSADWQSG
ncbi:MAG: ABC transporter substrate-binding protein [Candidatus Hodarchaeota archaeon]